MTTSNSISSDDSETKERIEYLFKIIGRYDTYLNAANTKGSLLVAWNGLVIGTVLLKYNEILIAFTAQGWRVTASLILVLIAFSAAASTLLVFRVVLPFLGSSNARKTGEILSDESALFFGTVANLTASEFERKISTMTPAGLLTDLTDQAVTLAIGLSNKMRNLRYSLMFAGIQPVLALMLILIKLLLF